MSLIQKLRSKEEIVIDYFLPFSIFFFFFLDALNGIYFFFIFESGVPFSISFLPKLFWEFLLILILSIRKKEILLKYKYFVFFILIILLLTALKNNNSFFKTVFILKHFNKLFLPFLFFIFLEQFRPLITRGIKAYELILIINSISIFIGFIFGFECFKSYPFTERFGYSGWFPGHSINDVSLFYLIANFYAFNQWKKGFLNFGIFVLIFGSSFFIGTKAVYLQNVILILYVIIADKKLAKYVLPFGALFIMLVLVFYNFTFWADLLEKKGLMAVLSSMRTELFLSKLPSLISELNLWNLMFGFSDPFRLFIEMDLYDLFIFLGVIGTPLFVFFYFKILFNFGRNDCFAWTFVFTFFLLVFLSGRYTYSGVNGVYLPFFIYYLKTLVSH
jgi:hypothetical protein